MQQEKTIVSSVGLQSERTVQLLVAMATHASALPHTLTQSVCFSKRKVHRFGWCVQMQADILGNLGAQRQSVWLQWLRTGTKLLLENLTQKVSNSMTPTKAETTH